MHERMPNPVVVLSSGGKDSLLMLDRLRADSAWDVRALVTAIEEGSSRVALHGTSEALIRQQAASLGLPLVGIRLPENCDNATYEERLSDGLKPFLTEGVRHIACGDLFLSDIRQWREALFARLGWEPVFPIWGESTAGLARTLAEGSWKLTLTCVDTEALPEHFLGRSFDRALLDQWPAGVDPCGENGEFHSFVHDGPGFADPVRWSATRTVRLHGRYAMLELQSAEPD
jgi:uncharacterized protein (TIGR00290 family)